jgi:hypothetical protein
MEVRFVQSTMTFDIDSLSNSHIRILCIERRFRKREIGHVLIDLSQLSAGIIVLSSPHIFVFGQVHDCGSGGQMVQAVRRGVWRKAW